MTEQEATPPATKAEDKIFKQFDEDTTAVYDVKAAKFEYVQKRAEVQLDKERWRNRRWMAWIALGSMIGMAAAVLFVVPETKLDKLDEIIAWFMMAMASIIGTYLGTTTWAYVSTAKAARGNRDNALAYGNTPYDDAYGGASRRSSNYYSES